MNTLSEIFKGNSSKVALVDTHRNIKLSYGELFQQTGSFKQQLMQEFGIRKADCISLVALNSVDFVTAFLGTAMMGCVSAPLNPKIYCG
ncbi:hypothetical protein DSO57_1012820 [Entomophthora muscae]|uniref:Uncharacterized protein n=1 Tax=Entomophthora muscae TaxID=34485 RepID=A0ACC2RKN5_9FUNG|nr:hypothetical protein DSO57_1012820 [Entomophthora muscae]